MKKQILSLLLLTLLFAGCSAPAQPTTPATEAQTTPATEAATETTAQVSGPAAPAFSTTDITGGEWTQEAFAQHSLTILNFWEPWCGPCVMEMPDLEKISQEYAEKGLLILGIYATPDAEADVSAVLERTGVTYPILHYTDAFNPMQTGYVPTTVLVDENGTIVYGPFSGALPHDSWVTLIEKYL